MDNKNTRLVLVGVLAFIIGWAIGFTVTLISLGAIYFTFRREREPAPAIEMPTVGMPEEVPA